MLMNLIPIPMLLIQKQVKYYGKSKMVVRCLDLSFLSGVIYFVCAGDGLLHALDTKYGKTYLAT